MNIRYPMPSFPLLFSGLCTGNERLPGVEKEFQQKGANRKILKQRDEFAIIEAKYGITRSTNQVVQKERIYFLYRDLLTNELNE